MLECGLRAVVLHDKGVVWNYYAECTADSRRINTNQKNVNRKKLTQKLYDGQTCFAFGIVNGAKNRISFPFPCNIMPSSVDFPNNELNILNQEIIGISNSIINADCLEIITEKSYAIGSPVTVYITWHYD